ncbi:hypothetical protein [Parvibaculum sp.]|uniref:hypothetical protein n=1 Tax=Parvibaculum sp. TaxID=2024848 RepID=UPI000C8ACE18|nr:hypothetical protein [Parvibaculum sp.]MAB13890.1 hypothetical protein [Parvibaculum sp.]
MTSDFDPNQFSDNVVFRLAQNRTFSLSFETARKIMIVVVPEHATISGGILSFFTIAQTMKKLKKSHGYEVLTMTRFNPQELTYIRNLNFVNSETVYRFDQITRCRGCQDMYIHVPECFAASFYDDLTAELRDYITSRETVHINILNQNTELMPEREGFADLYQLTDNISQSVAHEAYFSQQHADRYNLPTLFLPAYIDLGGTRRADFDQKEKLIIYSPDEAAHRDACLSKLRNELPDFQLVEIRDITFENFVDLATRCLFSISFGEGFDGYVLHPIHQGSIGLTAYREEFFPSRNFCEYPNIFETPAKMVEDIASFIREYSANRDAYENLASRLRGEYDRLYGIDRYVACLTALAQRKFDFYPHR